MSIHQSDPYTPMPHNRDALLASYERVRQFFCELCEPLATEDYVIQSMPDVSPAKWHLAHTSWFFETLLLKNYMPHYRSPHPLYAYLFNSYYISLGERHARPQRGLISRPTVQEVYDYRNHVDEHIRQLLEQADDEQLAMITPVLVLGLHHEQQHQELMLTDIKHGFSVNPLRPAYHQRAASPPSSTPPPIQWVHYPEEIRTIGYDGQGFCYDNEQPAHRTLVLPFRISNRLITNGEYLEFMLDGGYQTPNLWLSNGWYTVQEEQWNAPLYWEQRDGAWWQMTLAGLQPLNEAEPVCHVSYFEAAAFARWAGARLPTEIEWEVAATTTHPSRPLNANFAETKQFHPVPLAQPEHNQPSQLFGDVWEWTQSAYAPYYGYRAPAGPVGEYNGKFMCNQYVLRGGSCATSQTHIRPTYRNFFAPESRWQFSGIRLAQEA